MFTLIINWPIVIISVILCVLLRIFWYSKYGFGKLWEESLPKRGKDLRKLANESNYIFIILSLFVTIFILNIMIQTLGAITYQEGFLVAFVLWLGFTAITSLSDYLFIGRPSMLFLINNFYHLVAMLLSSAIIIRYL